MMRRIERTQRMDLSHADPHSDEITGVHQNDCRSHNGKLVYMHACILITCFYALEKNGTTSY